MEALEWLEIALEETEGKMENLEPKRQREGKKFKKKIQDD